jgi:hypothetical protein
MLQLLKEFVNLIDCRPDLDFVQGTMIFIFLFLIVTIVQAFDHFRHSITILIRCIIDFILYHLSLC